MTKQERDAFIKTWSTYRCGGGDYGYAYISKVDVQVQRGIFSGNVRHVFAAGPFKVWHVLPGHVFAGQGRQFVRTPARYILVLARNGMAHEIVRLECGQYWRNAIAALTSLAIERQGEMALAAARLRG